MSKEMELPNGWQAFKLGDVCQFEYGKGLVKGDRDPKGEFDVYGSNGLVGKHSSHLINEPCIIIGRKGAAGEVHLALKPSWPIDTTYFVKTNEKFVLKYLYYQLKTLRLASLETSTAIPGLNRNDAYAKKVLLPPITEQHQIVDKIEELFGELDKGIENLKTAQQQLKVYRQAVLKWAFEGKLTNENVKDGELPEGWELVTIGDIFEVFIGSTPSRKVDDYWKGQINWVSSGEVAFRNIYETKERITEKGLAETSCKVHPPGTVILAMIGEGKTRGQAAILKVSASHNQNTAAIRVPEKSFMSELLYYYLFMKYDENRKIGSGNNQKALNKERVKSIQIPLIPLKEQEQIVQEIESRLSVCDKMEETINTSLQQAEALRQSILKRAFEGKLLTKYA